MALLFIALKSDTFIMHKDTLNLYMTNFGHFINVLILVASVQPLTHAI